MFSIDKISKTAKIAVVGGGASGIHFASQLKLLGYKDVTIYEKSNEVGGQSHSPKIDGIPVDLGTIVAPIQHKPLKQFLQNIGAKVKPVTITDIMMKLNGKDIIETDSMKVFHTEYQEIHGKINYQLFKYKFILAFIKYAIKHQEMLDQYHYPKEEYAIELSQPFDKFLHTYRLEILAPFMNQILISWLAANGVQSYPTFEALQILNPSYFVGKCYQIDGGYQSVWEKAAKFYNLNILFNKEVTNIKTTTDGKVLLSFYDDNIDHQFDLLVMASPYAVKYLKNPSVEQQDILEQYKLSSPNVATIFQTHKNYDNIKVKYGYQISIPAENKVVATVDLYPKSKFATAWQSSFKIKKDGIITDKEREVARGELVKSLDKKYDYHNIKPIYEKWWPCFRVHCSEKAIAGKYPWKILNLEGKDNILYIGGAAGVYTVPSIIDFNHKIMHMDNDKHKNDFGNINLFSIPSTILELIGNLIGLGAAELEIE